MTFKVYPTDAEIVEAGAMFGASYTPEYAADLNAAISGFVAAANVAMTLPDHLPEVKYPRTPGTRPEGDANPYGAWYYKTRIEGAAEGPLKGKTVALKDNVLVAGVPMIYDGTRYPYFFADANGDDVIDTAEGRPVAFNAWTPRSLRAAFNWKLVTADPGNFAHNPQYSLELLYDSTADIAEALAIDMEDLGLLR